MRRKRTAFTLVELLLVLAIMGIVTAVAMPTFVRSLRGNRLRAAARTVAAAGRYARSMAVMRQQETQMIMSLESGAISVNVPPAAPSPPPDEDLPPLQPAAAPEGDAPEPAIQASEQGGGISRKLDRVKIAEIVSESAEDGRREGEFVVVYRTNGTCTPYSVRLEDSEGDSLLVSVDALSSARISRGK